MNKIQIDKIKKVSETLLESFKHDNVQGDKVLTCYDSKLILGSRKGPNRHANQDRVAIVEISNQLSTGASLVVAVLSDGMGGMAQGELAASTTLSAFVAYVAFAIANGGGLKKLSDEAALFANQVVYEQLNGKGGATLSAVVFGSKGAVCVNVGDSRVYFFNKQKGLMQLTNDDTLAGQVHTVKEERDAWFEPSLMDNRLAQHIGMGDGLIPHTMDLSNYGEYSPDEAGFFITSDGTHYIGKDMIEKIIENCPNLHDVPNRLISVSDYLSGHDNSSIIMLPPRVNISKTKKNGNVEVKINTINEKAIIIMQHLVELSPKAYRPQGLFDGQNKKQDILSHKKAVHKPKKNWNKKKSISTNKKGVKDTECLLVEEELEQENEIKVDIITVKKEK
jgi:serine/threonine protein phosphatase PrpC